MIEWITWAHSKTADHRQVTHRLELHPDNPMANLITEDIAKEHANRLNQKKYLGVSDWVHGVSSKKKDH